MTSAARPLPPWLTVSADPGDTDPGAADSVPAVVDGRACRTRAALFEEVARVLRFPEYFGRNWDALTDSLRDTGIGALIVAHAEELLSAEPPDQFATLLAVLAGSGMTVTLRTDPGHEDRLRRRAAAALT
jgi:hypothetical protein